MRTNSRPVTVFLFAHQDDEMGVFAEIQSTLSRGDCVACFYLTNGETAHATSETRNAESRKVMAALNVPYDSLFFVGTEYNIPDGKLFDHLEIAFTAALSTMHGFFKIAKLVIHAWEGGHQDHDAAHVLGLAIAKTLSLTHTSQQFALYRNDPSSYLPFVMFKPLKSNGAVIEASVPVWQRVFQLVLLLRYRSQQRSILGLGPFIAWHYLTRGTQQLQPINLERVQERPHEGKLLYENRAHVSYSIFREAVGAFCAKYGL
ncbi:PIG-L family deacetylase [Tardiphaga sp. vice154]|uniref:PIG-L family deacetylase n=1 Tax=Tardiphaga sp. vice154 TaxID=2592814 RepID=UPI001163E62C|nr:PIG-L family deacetylase [Tardiphaga sp. vice154]QDM23011.1 PIG-L family deacetylase [Tardiphaga sp. vice154]